MEFNGIFNVCLLCLCHLASVCYSMKSGNCPVFCHCSTLTFMDCSQQNLTGVPRGVNKRVTSLDLSMNNISTLQDFAFREFIELEVLRLVGNTLSSLPPNVFTGLSRLRELYLEGNRFRTVPKYAFHPLFSLQEMNLDANLIEDIPDGCFKGIPRLKVIRLGANKLERISKTAFRQLEWLDAIDLSVNKIKGIDDYTFQNNTQLSSLTLYGNDISYIGDHAFEGLRYLIYLELQRNKLDHIPPALISLFSLKELNLVGNRITHIPDRSFLGNKNLQLIKLKGNTIRSVGKDAFRDLPYLKELILSEVYDMTIFPNLTGTRRIKILRLDRASIRDIPNNLCQLLPNLEVLDMHSNKLTAIPPLSECHGLRQLNLGNNLILSLDNHVFRNLTILQDLTLSHNNIRVITADTFRGLHSLEYLDMACNKIESIHQMAFTTVTSLEDLNLSENNFPVLPTEGLKNLKKLKTFHNNALQEPIDAQDLPNIQILVLSYAYHCCNFRKAEKESEQKKEDLKDDDRPLNSWNVSYGNDKTFHPNMSLYPPFPDYKYKSIDFLSDYDDDYNLHPDNPRLSGAEYLNFPDTEVNKKPPVTCDPQPGPFLPCDDLFGWWSLRCGVWIVFLLAVVGNGVVLFVSITARSKFSMDVPRFLVCNLACADFFMGIYLGMLAIVDASSLGSFQQYAIKWQTSTGCLIAGFLGVISSELSVFTLTVITVERFYAISNALHFNKRLTLKQAGIVMSVGWAFCILNASLPLFGISDYRKFAICLPFEVSDRASLAYVCFLMLFNGASFMVIVFCYIKMYCSIMGSNAWNSKDFRIAKRMAILVFTDFLCWSPIIFFTVTSAFGLNLIGLNEAKVLTIFVLPLNSCANPFLYAIFTKQFKRDCVKLCKRIEESSISRSLSNMNSRRVSFGSSWRHSQLHSPFHLEKRSSISNSISGGSSVNGATVQNPDRVLSGEDKQNSKDVNYFFGKDIDSPAEKTQIPEKPEQILDQVPQDVSCKQNHLSVGATGSDTQIVIHFDDKENNMLYMHSCDEDESEHCRKCRMKKNKELRRDREKTNSANTGVDCTARKRHRDRTVKDGCGIKLPATSEKFKRRKIKKEDLLGFNRLMHVSSAPHVKMPDKEVLQLPVTQDTNDKISHINEWRKSSHLTYLWRNSLEVDGCMPKYKSNSLAELARSVKEFDGSPCKRRSLSSRHEGYILLKNNNRDSAYEDEEEMFEYNSCKEWSVEQCKHFKTPIPSVTFDSRCSRRQSACDAKDAIFDERQSLLNAGSDCSKCPSLKKDNYDKESGISSET